MRQHESIYSIRGGRMSETAHRQNRGVRCTRVERVAVRELTISQTWAGTTAGSAAYEVHLSEEPCSHSCSQLFVHLRRLPSLGVVLARAVRGNDIRKYVRMQQCGAHLTRVRAWLFSQLVAPNTRTHTQRHMLDVSGGIEIAQEVGKCAPVEDVGSAAEGRPTGYTRVVDGAER